MCAIFRDERALLTWALPMQRPRNKFLACSTLANYEYRCFAAERHPSNLCAQQTDLERITIECLIGVRIDVYGKNLLHPGCRETLFDILIRTEFHAANDEFPILVGVKGGKHQDR